MGEGRKRGRGRGRGKGRKRTLAHPLVPLVGEVGEGEVAADKVVEDEEAGMARAALPETEHGRTRTKPTVAITIGNATMTRRWPVLDDPRAYTYSLYCAFLLMRSMNTKERPHNPNKPFGGWQVAERSLGPPLYLPSERCIGVWTRRARDPVNHRPSQASYFGTRQAGIEASWGAKVPTWKYESAFLNHVDTFWGI